MRPPVPERARRRSRFVARSDAATSGESLWGQAIQVARPATVCGGTKAVKRFSPGTRRRAPLASDARRPTSGRLPDLHQPGGGFLLPHLVARHVDASRSRLSVGVVPIPNDHVLAG